jgi:hypothetical protein
MTIEVPPSNSTRTRETSSPFKRTRRSSMHQLSRGATEGDPLLAATPVASPEVLLAARYRKDRRATRCRGGTLRRRNSATNSSPLKPSPDVVAKERAKLAGYEAERERVRGQLAVLDAGDSAAP